MAKNRSMAIKHAKARKMAMLEMVARAQDKSAFELRQGDWAVAPSSINDHGKYYNVGRWKRIELRKDHRTGLEQWAIEQLMIHDIQ